MQRFLPGGGEMGARMRALDWSKTALGPIGGWPQSLRTALSIMLGSRYPMFLWWGASLVNFYNDGYIPVLGKRHPGALGVNARELWAEIWHVVGPQADGVMRTGEATWNDRQLLVMERNGFVEETYFSWSYSPARDESGAVAGVFCACTEDTRRVLGERRMRTLREVAADAQGAQTAQAACEAAMRAMAKNRHDLPFALLYLADGAGRGRLAAAMGWEGAPAAVELEPLIAQGAWPLAAGGVAAPGAPWPEPITRALAVPIAQAGGAEAAGMLVAGMSPRLALDDDYRSFLDILAGQVARAIADAKTLEEERRRAQALAELDRAKTAFFSNISHEFRTPLTLMLGPLEEMLVQPDLPQADTLRLVQRNGQRLLKLVNTLLDFSRIEAGRAQARYAPTDLARLTADLASAFRSAVEKAGLELVVDCAPLAEPAYVDREMWEKIVLNLLSNAFKFTFSGSIHVALRLEKDFILEVRDTGTGIPAAELPRVFERFHRVEGARSRTHESTGIGLALVHELARLHGGAVSVRSTEGGGSTFTVTVPRGSAHLPAGHVSKDGRAAPASQAYVQEALGWLPGAEPAPAQAAQGARIVWADDNADMREYVRGLLAPRYAVETAADGEAALAAVRRQRPDLVLADVMMPKLDGLGLARALRADPATRGIPVVLLSARAGEEARIEGFDAGADDYLQKPFSARELLARVDALLQTAALRGRIREQHADLGRLFAETPVPIAVLRGPQLVFEIANPAYVEVADGRELVGKPLLEALPEARGQGYDELLREVMRTGRPHVGREAMVKLRRGGVLQDTWFTFIYAPLRAEDGAADRVIAIVNEVTEEVRARRQLEAADRRKDEFLATLSHELRNPLAPIRNAVSLLNETDADPALAAKARGILERQVAHIVRLVDDLLDVTRITRGQISLRKQRVPVAQVVAAAVETSRPLVDAGAHQLVLHERSPGASVLADPVRLAQVVANLLNNAARYTPRGGRIELESRSAGGWAEIAVRDNGPGIAAGEMARLFEMFTQGEGTRARVPGGLGIGLALARQFAELHGGALEGHSDGPGRGATFTLRVPLHSAQCRILVVDDNDDAAEGFAAHLRHRGHQVRTAADGQQALAIAREFDPQVALVDISLPGMSGYELAHRLRPTPALLIALTGHGQLQDRVRAEQAGFHHHFVKPADPREIDAAIGAWAS